MSARRIVSIGELLWDLLPDGKQLGGAAANFSVMAARLGNRSVIASATGGDALGNEARSILAQLPVDGSYLQQDAKHPTGSVSVTLNEGQPEYVIHEPVAWDFLEFTPAWKKLAEEADAICFNTLAQRNAKSRDTIRTFLASASPDCVRVFDVNLRAPFYDASVIHDSLALANLLKLNDAEMLIVLKLLGLSSHLISDEASFLFGAQLLLHRYAGLRLICTTMGGNGSLLVTRESHHRHVGIPITIADTVGAGDAFTAALVHYYLQGASLATMNEAGNQWGSWVASQKGAMPPLSDAVRGRISAQVLSASS